MVCRGSSTCAMTVLYFYTCLILKLTLVAGQPVHYILKGRDAVLSPALPSAPNDILWKHNGDKVITFDSAGEHVFTPYEGRVTLGHETAKLTIADVRYQDSGEYELDALIRGRLYRSQYMVKVLDKVSKPVIRCEVNDESGDPTVRRATLLCSSDSDTPETLTFKWNLEGKSQLGQSLSITLGNEHDHMEYSCTATNPLQAETSVFMAKDCYTERSDAPDVIIPVVIGIASVILLALCIGILFICLRRQKKACFKQKQNGDLDKKTTETDNKSKDEGKPLMGGMNQQERSVSAQPPIQQNDCVVAIPQNQEIANDLEELRTFGNVKERLAAFANAEQTVLHRDTEIEEKKDTDIGEVVSAEHASPIRNGQVDSDGETDHHNRPEPERGGDADSHQSSEYSDASEHQEPQSPSLSSDPQGLLKLLKHEAELYNSNQDAVPKTNTAGDSSSIQSDQEDTTKSPEQKDFPCQPPRQSNVAVSDQDSQPETVEYESREQTGPDDKSGPVSASELKDPQTDVPQNKSVTSKHEAAGESELSNDSQTSPLHSEPPESLPLSPASVQDKMETSAKSDPELKDPQTDSDHERVRSDNNNENTKDSALTDAQPSDTHQLAVGSASSQSELKENQNAGANVKSDSITETPHEPHSPTEYTSTGDFKQPDCESKDESSPFMEETFASEQHLQQNDSVKAAQQNEEIAEEMKGVAASGRFRESFKMFANLHPDRQTGSVQKAAKSTHPPASALSQSAHNKESKDTGAENVSSAQVSEETKANTDKETDSQDSEQTNEATKEGQQ